jgi:DNA modification methylase
MAKLQIIYRPIDELGPAKNNPRTHSKKQLAQLQRSIQQFGFTNPVLVSDSGEIVAGHGRVQAARLAGMTEVPTICLSSLTPEQRRAYVIADNKLALNAGWDKELLAIEFQSLIDLGFDLEITGFDLAEIDFVIDAANEADPSSPDAADRLPPLGQTGVTARGDVWQLGRHRLMCGDTRDADHVATLMQGEEARIAFLDPPWNVPVQGHIGGNGRIKHAEFAFASGEMSDEEFASFLTLTLANTSTKLADGAIAYVCIDWRHFSQLEAAGRESFSELKNVVVWNKGVGAQGSFYRSQYELILIFKKGTAEHINTFGLGETGRYRTNLWTHRGMSSFGKGREDLELHPTVKPIELVADALRDCSRRGDVVLDTFGGSGSTLIAAEKTGRVARLLEYDGIYCDRAVQRWEQFTGKAATLIATGETFEEVSLLRKEAA